ncbi:DUF2809 domain-containing protein [Rudanella paleaurantiibacter]|uniref:DUF2809 domain-containing protein n=1 Tax=Rudanella paleaurantiibacter TaxID=2614655 RepID=A0A7J5TZ74_9BACT|nr:DUF2809 domain-containing protein [Rudanella paleaurantiibacter]KAB7730426.1 DUF2809 domain-containing protein [Rudanella paleaurantiibacter]
MTPPTFSFTWRYFLIAVALFVVEVLIALFVRDRFVRPYGGDYLVVIMLYYGVKAFVRAPPRSIALGVLLFAYTLELLQYFRLVDRLGLSHNEVAKTVIGYGFEWWDMLAYTLGIITVLVWEERKKRLRPLLDEL